MFLGRKRFSFFVPYLGWFEEIIHMHNVISFQEPHMMTVSNICESGGKGKEGKERKKHMCSDGEKDTLRGTRTHTFWCPGRCPNPVRLEETS